jgi:hypothetical protein
VMLVHAFDVFCEGDLLDRFCRIGYCWVVGVSVVSVWWGW